MQTAISRNRNAICTNELHGETPRPIHVDMVSYSSLDSLIHPMLMGEIFRLIEQIEIILVIIAFGVFLIIPFKIFNNLYCLSLSIMDC